MRLLRDWMAKRRLDRQHGESVAAFPSLTATTLARLLADGQDVQLVDIRDHAAYQKGHLPGARHCPREQLERTAMALDRARATVVY